MVNDYAFAVAYGHRCRFYRILALELQMRAAMGFWNVGDPPLSGNPLATPVRCIRMHCSMMCCAMKGERYALRLRAATAFA